MSACCDLAVQLVLVLEQSWSAALPLLNIKPYLNEQHREAVAGTAGLFISAIYTKLNMERAMSLLFPNHSAHGLQPFSLTFMCLVSVLCKRSRTGDSCLLHLEVAWHSMGDK